jgi:hypothetical protein
VQSYIIVPLMPNMIGRVFDRIASDWRVIMGARATFGIASLLLIGTTAYITLKVAESFYTEQYANIDSTIRNLQIQIGQLSKESSPQSLQVYGSSRLQLLDIHVVFDPPRKPNIFGNVINKGAMAARGPSSGASYLVAPRDLTPRELDGLASQATDGIRIGNPGVEFQPDAVHGFSIDFNMTQEQFQQVRDQKQKFYLVYAVAYRDETIPADKMRLTETCYVYAGDFAQGQLCPEHNRTFIADSPAAK